jgi:hypothetical protein
MDDKLPTSPKSSWVLSARSERCPHRLWTSWTHINRRFTSNSGHEIIFSSIWIGLVHAPSARPPPGYPASRYMYALGHPRAAESWWDKESSAGDESGLLLSASAPYFFLTFLLFFSASHHWGGQIITVIFWRDREGWRSRSWKAV